MEGAYYVVVRLLEEGGGTAKNVGNIMCKHWQVKNTAMQGIVGLGRERHGGVG